MIVRAVAREDKGAHRGMHGLLEPQAAIVEVGRRQLVLFVPVVLGVPPLRFVEPFRHQMYAAHQVAGVEVLRVEPGLPRLVRLVGAKGGCDPFGPQLVHVVEQPANKLTDKIGPHRPAHSEVAENPCQVGDAGQHYPAISDRSGRVKWGAVHGEGDITEDAQVQARGRNDYLGRKRVTGLQLDPLFRERGDLVGYESDLPGRNFLEQVAVRNQGQALLPGPVLRREMLLDVEVLGKEPPDAIDQFRLYELGLLPGEADEDLLVMKELFPHNGVGQSSGTSISRSVSASSLRLTAGK